MKGVKITLVLVVCCVIGFCFADLACALSKSLTTTIIITVKGNPKSNMPQDQDTNPKSNISQVNQHIEAREKAAKLQTMAEPCIKEVIPDIKFSGEKIYTITGKL